VLETSYGAFLEKSKVILVFQQKFFLTVFTAFGTRFSGEIFNKKYSSSRKIFLYASAETLYSSVFQRVCDFINAKIKSPNTKKEHEKNYKKNQRNPHPQPKC
jgi:hypothetical protein